MTDDLVQRLRSHADGWLDGTEGGAMLTEAADALERLQAEVEWQREVARQAFVRGLQGLRYRIADQAAEVVRLQQALRDLLDAEDDTRQPAPPPNAWLRRLDAFAAARAVLEGNQQ